jgi:hypothetical protein
LLDIGFTQDINRKLNNVLSDITETTLVNSNKLRILSVCFNNSAEKKELEERCKMTLPNEETIFLIKNQYFDKLRDFRLGDFMQNSRIFNVDLSDMPTVSPNEH